VNAVTGVLFLAVFGAMLAEARRASRNERTQRNLGGVEPKGDVYPWMRVAYPAAFLAMFAEGVARGAPPLAVWLAGGVILALAKLLKWWAIVSLGSSWTFRVIVVPGKALVTTGPYRVLRHPNYVAVVGELAGVAIATGAVFTGPVALVIFGALLMKRMTVEERMFGLRGVDAGAASWPPVVIAAALGAAFFVWIAGVRMIDPREIGWLMRSDWQQHFLGWHLFRHEPWHLPPGRIAGEFFPIGTSVALTDSVPLLAFPLKLVSALLPDPFQYLGLWLVVCFALQGAAGALLIGCWTESVVLRVIGGSLFVLAPILLDRVGHVALCAHWLLLVAFWMYFRRDRSAVALRILQWAALVLVAAFVQPYLWLMVIALSLAAAIRFRADGAYGVRDVALHLLSATGISVAAAWGLGWLLLKNAEERRAGGLGYYSMNMLGPFASNGWSAIIPGIPIFEGQSYEGFNYLGAGTFMLVCSAAVLLARRPPTRATVRAALPLAVVCALLALASLSHRVTMAQVVVADVGLPPWLDTVWSTFRSTGRLFWPAGYLVTMAAIATVVKRATPGPAVALLTAAVALQAFDSHGRYLADRATRSDPAWYAWADPTSDREWDTLARQRHHLVELPTEACGQEPVPYAKLLYFAAAHGLTVNTGSAGRFNLPALSAACAESMRTAAAGDLDRDTIYVVASRTAEPLRSVRQPLVCWPLAGAIGCVVDVDAAPVAPPTSKD
jgi:isoprenylcysteine carboxyl methyltransferase (ICMT) family protein YpbQ